MQKYAETQQVLLREVNHRVKNNLTAMISMLHQEEDRTSTENSGKKFKSRIQDIVGRTESLLIVHSLLSSSHWKPLLLKQLCGEIISHTIQGMAQKEAVRFQIDCSEDVYVSSDQAHNLTLIFNELATNTVKYARGENKTSMIQLFIEKREQTIHIVFHDNGPGYPDFVLAKKDFSRNIGFQLISGFVRKNLHGTLEVFNDGGAVTSISFPMNQSSNQDKDGIDYGE
jgi:two-component sensor histidine kinase